MGAPPAPKLQHHRGALGRRCSPRGAFRRCGIVNRTAKGRPFMRDKRHQPGVPPAASRATQLGRRCGILSVGFDQGNSEGGTAERQRAHCRQPRSSTARAGSARTSAGGHERPSSGKPRCHAAVWLPAPKTRAIAATSLHPPRGSRFSSAPSRATLAHSDHPGPEL